MRNLRFRVRQKASRAPTGSRRAEGRRLGRDGFTLVEVLTAFLVLAAFLVVVQRGFVVARTGLARAEAWAGAEAVARTLLETAPGAPSSPGGRLSGSTGGHHWTVATEALALPAVKASEGDAPLWRPTRVTIQVAVARGVMLEVETVRVAKGSGE